MPTENAFVIPGANFDSWAPNLLEPLDPWATDGPLVPQINASYYDCAGCAVTVIHYPRTAGPLFGPCAPFADESITIGADAVLTEIRDAEGPSVISALSLGSMTADAVQRRLDTDPNRPAPSQVTFIMAGDPSRATPLTTGIGSFFPVGLRIPVLGWTVARPSSESSYDTVVVVGEYDWAGDFPDRPWNLLADLNALVGFNFTHSEAALSSPAGVPPDNIVITTNSQGATTTTYLVPSPIVPLLRLFDRVLAPPVIAAANDVLKPLIDRGYSRYDTMTGNRMPYLEPTDGLPRLEFRLPQQLLERDGIRLTDGLSGLGEPTVAGGGVEGLGLRLPVAGGQVDPAVAGGDDADLQFSQQPSPVAAAAVPPVGPDAFELGGFRALDNPEAAEGTSGHRNTVKQPDQHSTGRRGELVSRVPAQPPQNSLLAAVVPGGVLDGEFGDERLGQLVIRADLDENQGAQLNSGRGKPGRYASSAAISSSSVSGSSR